MRRDKHLFVWILRNNTLSAPSHAYTVRREMPGYDNRTLTSVPSQQLSHSFVVETNWFGGGEKKEGLVYASLSSCDGLQKQPDSEVPDGNPYSSTALAIEYIFC
jgi:hypothetical protein